MLNRKAVTLPTTVTLNGVEIDCTVEGHYSPATPDVLYMRNGDPGYPGDPSETGLYRVVRDDTKEDVLSLLSETQLDALREEVTQEGEAQESPYDDSFEDDDGDSFDDDDHDYPDPDL